MLFPAPLAPTRAMVSPGKRLERHIFEHRNTGCITKRDPVKDDMPFHSGQALPPAGRLLLGRLHQISDPLRRRGRLLQQIDALGQKADRPVAIARYPKNETSPPGVISPRRTERPPNQRTPNIPPKRISSTTGVTVAMAWTDFMLAPKLNSLSF